MLLRGPVALNRVTVGECLDKLWFTAQRTTPIRYVMDLVHDHGARFVCVTDAEGRAVALTGQKGLSEYIADHFPRQVMVQRLGGKPGLAAREGA